MSLSNQVPLLSCMDFDTNNPSLNSPNFDPFFGEGSSRNLYSETPKEGFDLSEAYANGVSTEFRAYPSTSLVPNGTNPVLHGSGTIGFLDNSQEFGVQTVFENSIYQPMSCQDQYRSTKTTVLDEISYISETNLCNRNSEIIKGPWTPQEDWLLMSLVKPGESNKWSQIAKMINGRLGKQCRERWYNHLRPNIKKSTWTEQEDLILIEKHSILGNHWAKIALSLPGRTENSVKNHWNSTKRRLDASCRKTKSSIPRNAILQDYIRYVEKLSSTTPPSTSKPDTEAQEPPLPNTQALEESSNAYVPDDWQVTNSDHNEACNGVAFDIDIFNDDYNFGPFMFDEVPSSSIVDEGNLDRFEIPSEIDTSFMK